jgi:hypothetical protein
LIFEVQETEFASPSSPRLSDKEIAALVAGGAN